MSNHARRSDQPTGPPRPNSRVQTMRLEDEGDYVDIWLPIRTDWVRVYGNGYVEKSSRSRS